MGLNKRSFSFANLGEGKEGKVLAEREGERETYF